MGKNYNSYSYKDYPPPEILVDSHYKQADKALSIQYRDKESDKMIAYISLGKNEPPINLPSINDKSKGCEILMANVRKIVTTDKWQISDSALINAIIEEAEFRIEAWCEHNSPNEVVFAFDYYWLDVSNDKLQEVVERVDWTNIVGNIAYKVIDR